MTPEQAVRYEGHAESKPRQLRWCETVRLSLAANIILITVISLLALWIFG